MGISTAVKKLNPYSRVLPGWADEARYTAIKDWAQELKILSGDDKGSLNWALVGRAAMIVNGNEDHVFLILNHAAQMAGYKVVALGADDVFKFFAAGFKDINEPTLVTMKQGIWSANAEDHKNSEEISCFQQHFSQILADIPDQQALVFVTYGEEYISLTETFRAIGGFDRRFYVDDLCNTDRAEMFFSQIPQEICGESLLRSKEKVGQLLECEINSDRRLGLVCLALKRLANREKRQIELMDLLHFALHGTAECVITPPAAALKKNIAVHEAGHALISIVDSSGADVPDYAGIVPAQGTLGQVSMSYSYIAGLPSYGGYKHKRHMVRMLLAGRAAEHLVLGVEEVSATSAKADLRHASSIAKELVGRLGISGNFEDESNAGSNLLIRSNDTSANEKYRIETEARLFLARQYEVVMDLLRNNRTKLLMIADQLLEKRMLTQGDLEKIMAE